MNNKQKEMCIAIKKKKLLSLAIISQTIYNLRYHKAKGLKFNYFYTTQH